MEFAAKLFRWVSGAAHTPVDYPFIFRTYAPTECNPLHEGPPRRNRASGADQNDFARERLSNAAATQ
jgi:hypothetical protein